MKIYRVKPTPTNRWIFNSWALGSILLLLSLTFIGFGEHLDRRVGELGAALAIATVVFGMPFTFFLLYKKSMQQFAEKLVFEVDDEKITTKKGSQVLSTVRFDEITTAGEYKGWFIAGNKSRSVRIPITVEGFADLRRSLETGRSLEPLKVPSSLFSYLYPAFFVGLLVVFLVTTKVGVALACGAVLSIMTVYSSYQLFRLLKRKSLLIGIGITLMNALIWIYLMYYRAHSL